MTRALLMILEPIMNVDDAPNDFAGDLMGDLNGCRGLIAGWTGTARQHNDSKPSADEQMLTSVNTTSATVPSIMEVPTTRKCRAAAGRLS